MEIARSEATMRKRVKEGCFPRVRITCQYDIHIVTSIFSASDLRIPTRTAAHEIRTLLLRRENPSASTRSPDFIPNAVSLALTPPDRFIAVIFALCPRFKSKTVIE